MIQNNGIVEEIEELLEEPAANLINRAIVRLRLLISEA